MFTGLVEEVGVVAAIEGDGDRRRFEIRGPSTASGLSPGDSVSVAGVCLTAVEVGEESFRVDVVAETLDRTSLSAVDTGAAVNLELAAEVGDRLGGHIVQGHVDGLATVVEAGERLRLSLPAELARYVVEKGSIAIDGVSLTVAGLTDSDVEIALIPHTLASTSLGTLEAGQVVNVEVDILAKYVERLMEAR